MVNFKDQYRSFALDFLYFIFSIMTTITFKEEFEIIYVDKDKLTCGRILIKKTEQITLIVLSVQDIFSLDLIIYNLNT